MRGERDEGRPPEQIPAGRLFRMLSSPKRARWPLDFRLPFAPDIALGVQALSGAEYSAAYDADGLTSHIVAGTAATQLVAACLCTDEGLALSGPGPLCGLTYDDLVGLSGAVSKALQIVSPIYGVSDHGSWDARLRDGVMSGANVGIAIRMSEAVDVSVGWGGVHRQQRPDRYYGRPLWDLTDGQLMAYRAACAVVDSMRPDG